MFALSAGHGKAGKVFKGHGACQPRGLKVDQQPEAAFEGLNGCQCCSGAGTVQLTHTVALSYSLVEHAALNVDIAADGPDCDG